jgi:hypothetical protein
MRMLWGHARLDPFKPGQEVIRASGDKNLTPKIAFNIDPLLFLSGVNYFFGLTTTISPYAGALTHHFC